LWCVEANETGFKVYSLKLDDLDYNLSIEKIVKGGLKF
jgi:hypothetical protein